MARKPPAKTTATAGKLSAAKGGAGKAAVKKRGAKKAAGKNVAAKKTVAKKLAAKKIAAKNTSAKKVPAKKAVAKSASKAAKRASKSPSHRLASEAQAKPAARRVTSRISATRRAAARKIESHEALVKKQLAEPPKRGRKAAKSAKSAAKSAGKKARASKTAQTRPPSATPGKTARSRIDARASQKLSSPVLRGGARTPVSPDASTRSKGSTKRATSGGAASGRRAPFRLHSLGVRDAHPTDWPQIERLLNQTFERDLEATQIAAARAAGGPALALVAEYEGEIVGYLAFHALEAQLGGAPLAAAALAPLAVAGARQGRGIGSTLLSAGLEAARATGFEALFVTGAPGFFERFGFNAQDAGRFEAPSLGEALLALLERATDPEARGRLAYPAPIAP